MNSRTEHGDYALVTEENILYAVHDGVKYVILPYLRCGMPFPVIARMLSNRPAWGMWDAFLVDLEDDECFLSPIVSADENRCADIARRLEASLNAEGDLNVSAEDIAWLRAHVTSEQMIPSCFL